MGEQLGGVILLVHQEMNQRLHLLLGGHLGSGSLGMPLVGYDHLVIVLGDGLNDEGWSKRPVGLPRASRLAACMSLIRELPFRSR